MHLSGVSSHHHTCTFFYAVFCGWGKSICWIGGDARSPSHGGLPSNHRQGPCLGSWEHSPGHQAGFWKHRGFVIALLRDLPK